MSATNWDHDLYDATVFRDKGKEVARRRRQKEVSHFRVNGKHSPFTIYPFGRTSEGHGLFKITPGSYNGLVANFAFLPLTDDKVFEAGIDFSESWMTVDVWVVWSSPPVIELFEGGVSSPTAPDSTFLGRIVFNVVREVDGFLELEETGKGMFTKIGNLKDYSYEWDFGLGAGPQLIEYRTYAEDQTA